MSRRKAPDHKTPFDMLAPNMQTGDLMLFNGKYKGSKFIEFLEKSQWSHVGIIVRYPGIDKPLIFEATSLTNIPDAIFHDQEIGVKCVDLEQRMAHYGDDLPEYEPANFAYRKLIVDRTPEMQAAIDTAIHKFHGIPDPGFFEMIWDVVLGRILNKSVPLDHYFCSELVAEAYLEMGLIDAEKPINAYMPSDFSDQGEVDLLKGRFEPEIFVSIDHL